MLSFEAAESLPITNHKGIRYHTARINS